MANHTRGAVACFLAGVAAITWGCAFAMEAMDGAAHLLLFTLLDFLENASPLLMAGFLLREPLFRGRGLRTFLFGRPAKRLQYLLASLIFLLQYWDFRAFSLQGLDGGFLGLFLSQLLLGGGLEEGGWRGYLFPALCQRYPVLLSAVLTSLAWAFWHLPYFFLPSGTQQGIGFLAYLWIGVITGFCLAALYVLTQSVLLCMVFHAFQNALVMACSADTGNPAFQVVFVLLGLFSVSVCAVFAKRQGRGTV